MPKPNKVEEPTLEVLTDQLAQLRHDMQTCGFNNYGVKRNTYFSWLNRVEKIHRGLANLPKKKAPTPPPVPVHA